MKKPGLEAGLFVAVARSYVWVILHLGSPLASRSRQTGTKAYLEAIEGSFGADVDYVMLVKIYGRDPTGEKRYSPAE
jgi:hypothetical protein